MRHERSIEHRDEHQTNIVNLQIKAINEQDNAEQIWSETESLLRRKSYHISEKDYDPQKRVLLTRLSGSFTTASLAREIGVDPYTAHKVIPETLAAAIYAANGSLVSIPMEELPANVLDHYDRFKRMEDDRNEIVKIFQTEPVAELLDRSPALNLIAEQVSKDGVVSPLLDELGIAEVSNVNSYTNLFLRQGFEKGGTARLMRRVLYAQWLNSESIYGNYYKIPVQRSFSKYCLMAYKNEYTDPVYSRNLSHFASFLIQKDFEIYYQNYSIDSDWFSDTFPTFSSSFDSNIGVNIEFQKDEINSIAQERLRKFYRNGRFSFSINPTHYYLKKMKGENDVPMESLVDFAERYVVDPWRVPFCDEIAEYRKRRSNTSRKIFDAGVTALDGVLSLESFDKQTINRSVRPSILQQQFSEYSKIVKSLTSSNVDNNRDIINL